MQITHWQTHHDTMQSRKEECEHNITVAQRHVETLINDYVTIKRLRPVFASEYLELIHHALERLALCKETLASIIANPDCPF